MEPHHGYTVHGGKKKSRLVTGDYIVEEQTSVSNVIIGWCVDSLKHVSRI